jgi:LmbE family N-acetylglucosaminyl deacetylase
MTGIDPPAGPILVIAPHPDDETLGCGGLICLAMRGGQRLHTVFVTDGGASHRNSFLWDRTRLAACREAEAAEALRRLGAGKSGRSFLRLPDADMPPRGSAHYGRAKSAVVAILRDLQPRLVVLPWRRDPHRDHRDAWSLGMDCLLAAGTSADILEYAIWLDELGSRADHPQGLEVERVSLDISEVQHAKKDALKAHRSQLGELITDDPAAFVLSKHTIDRLTGPEEIYWRPCASV